MELFLALIFWGGVGYGLYLLRKWLRRQRPAEKRPAPTSYGSAKFAEWDDPDAYRLTAGKGYPLGVWFGREAAEPPPPPPPPQFGLATLLLGTQCGIPSGGITQPPRGRA